MMALLHPMKSRILAGATMVLALGLGSGVQGTVISTNQADFAYEGNDVPAGGGWSGFTDTMSSTPEYTIVDDTAGGVWTRSVTLSSAPTGGTQFFQAYKAGAMNDLTFTLDWRVARPLIQGTAGFQQDGPQLDVLVDLDGPGGSDDARRLVFSIGDSYYGGVGWDLTVTDMSTHFDGDGTGTTEGIAGLNISNFNVFRVVGLGDGSYKIYMNGVAAPIRTGNLAAASASGASAGRLNTGMQTGFPGGGPVEIEMQTDYIRLLSGEARDMRPIPEPSAIALLGLGGLALCMRRRRGR